ncbi:MAG: 2-amino-4-hydroxy-6-hydroxymethyldihydropteridine diphosphokinase [Acidimicrobiia bacterium]|nr:2-amino-4-hydroxy-6-hydroxymethyldihydropteridine diphosphokinase [Acidimicrobiia bacterium]
MRVAVGLGSNMEDRRHQLETAVSELSEVVGAVVAVSSLYESVAVGGPVQDPFLNAVVVVETDHPPQRVLGALQKLEMRHHRTRDIRWGPRTLDLDIIATDEGPLRTPDLVVPHVRAHKRRFVLKPLREVWPEVLLADGKQAALNRELPDQPLTLVDRNWWSEPS